MALKERVLGLLRGPEALRIRFTAPATSGPVTINRATFATVAKAIDDGKIGVTPFTPTARAGAQYNPVAVPAHPSGELQVPPILGRFEEAAVMHESTHAFFDLTKSGIGATEEEAVCMVVSALYYRMTGLTPARWWPDAQLVQSAKSVANALLHQYQAGFPGIPVVDAGAFRALVIAVALDPTYLIPTSLTSGTPAGLFGGLFGGPTSYTHNG